jgi:hypothetical protein
VFANFNILIYAENYVFPAAADRDMKELNREELYDLYYAARDLEPQPKHAELNYSQRMLVNKARKFITFRQRKRMAIRDMKADGKEKKKMTQFLSEKI